MIRDFTQRLILVASFQLFSTVSQLFSINFPAMSNEQRATSLSPPPLSLSLSLSLSLALFPPRCYSIFLSSILFLPVFFSSPCFTRSFPLARPLLFSFFFPCCSAARSRARDRPSFSLTLGIPPSRLFIAILPSSTIQSRGTSPFPFFLLSSFLPAIIRFHWPSVPRRGNSGERLPYLRVWG